MSEPLIPDAAVQAIKDSEQTGTLTVSENEYTTRPVFLPPPEAAPRTLHLNTLTGIVDFVNFDQETFSKNLAVHVEGHDTVHVVSGLYGRGEQRAIYATATAEQVLGRAFSFGSFVDCETFIISLQSLFVGTEELADVLRVVGNIKEEQVKQASDDGITQTVTAKAGIVRVEEVQVPNPVTLQPYRTFREVEQPASAFVLRMRQGREGQLPSCALFEADGGKWKLDAIEAVTAFLTEKLSETPIIA